MSVSSAALVRQEYGQTHRVILKFLHRLTDAQLHHQLSPHTHAIAWHTWHLARWADYLQASLPGMNPALARLGNADQVWHTEALATAWGFKPEQLGYHETGMDMPDAVALNMRFPAHETLLAYVQAAFDLAESRINSLSDEDCALNEQLQPLTEGIWAAGTVGGAIFAHITHENRHLGMMEALLGIQGQRGSATR